MSLREIFEELKDIKCFEDSSTVSVSSKYYYALLQRLDELATEEETNIEEMYTEYLQKQGIPC